MRKIIVIFLLGFSLLLYTTGQAKSTERSGVVYNVRNFGATGDGKHLDHGAINKAIIACADAGGGTVIFPAGNYLCGSIHLKSNIRLYLDAGTVISGAPPEMHAYDTAEAFPFQQFQDGGHTFFHNSLIWGEDLHDISITGPGMISGSGLTNKDKEKDGTVWGGAIETGDKAIALKNCRHIVIRDITIFHGGHFAILVTGCDLVTLDNLLIDTNRDGIDLDGCSNSIVSNCKVNSPNDDAICPKSSYALNKPVVTENLLITNCEVSAYREGTLLDGTRIPSEVGWSGGRIKFGTESNGGFRNCVVSNCIFKSCNGLALEEVDGGEMNNIIVDNIVMENVRHYPIYITLGSRNRGPLATTKEGSVKNIYISNIRVLNADSLSGIQITGVPDYAIQNIQLRHITVQYQGGGTKADGLRSFPELAKGYPEPFLLGKTPAYGLFVRHVQDLTLSDIQFETIENDERPVMYCNDVNGIEIDELKAPVARGIPAAVLHNVKNIEIRHAPLFQSVVAD